MAKFLSTTGTNYHLEELIKSKNGVRLQFGYELEPDPNSGSEKAIAS